MTQQTLTSISASALPPADAADDTRITAEAVGLFVANAAYSEAIKTSTPAATMDDICDVWPEIAPQVVRAAKATPELAEMLKDAVTDRLWAFTAVEHARAEVDQDYNYLFDFLVEQLRAGADPHSVRTTALGVPERLRAQQAA